MAKGLGKGINALFANMDVGKEDAVQEVNIKELRPNPYQPRKNFEPEALNELKNPFSSMASCSRLSCARALKDTKSLSGNGDTELQKKQNLQRCRLLSAI